MLDLLLLTRAGLRAAYRSRGDLVLENLLLRHQLTVLTRPTRRPRATQPPGRCVRPSRAGR